VGDSRACGSVERLFGRNRAARGERRPRAGAFARAGVARYAAVQPSIFVNQSAAFSDYHVTGANPAGNACLTDAAFVANRFRVAMIRRQRAA